MCNPKFIRFFSRIRLFFIGFHPHMKKPAAQPLRLQLVGSHFLKSIFIWLSLVGSQ